MKRNANTAIRPVMDLIERKAREGHLELSKIEQLERLAKLHSDGLLSAEEFALEKGRVLGHSSDIPSSQNAHAENREDDEVQPEDDERRFFISLAIVVTLAGVVGGALIINGFPSQNATEPVVAATAAAQKPVVTASPKPSPTVPADMGCVGRSCRILTPKGLAGIEAGMTVAQAQAASGLRIRSDGHYDDIVDGDCRSYEVIGGPSDISMLVEDGKVTSLGTMSADFKTDKGIRVGDSESKLRKLYTPVSQEADVYGDGDEKVLYFNIEGGKFGLVFHVSAGKVTAITVGGSSRGYVEGCL